MVRLPRSFLRLCCSPGGSPADCLLLTALVGSFARFCSPQRPVPHTATTFVHAYTNMFRVTAFVVGKTAFSPPPPCQPSPCASQDVFYPEFEHIRATGMLPTGQPVPLPSFAHSYGTGSARQQAPAASNPFSYGHPAAAAGQAPQGGGAALGARPTIAIPPAPQHPVYGYSGASPAARASPGYSATSAQSPAGSLVSPGGSAYSAGGGASNGVAALRSSTGSLSELMPGSAAPTPAAHRLGDPFGAAQDPFAGLAPGLQGAGLPSSGSARFGAAAPPPTPAGMPSFHAGASSPYGAPPAAAPFAASLPSPAANTHGMAASTAAATATLYGRTPSVSGYDLAAPSAPKPQATGNPFA